MSLDDLQPEERRVILAARKGPVSAASFNGISPTVDGLPPHTRLGARIYSLKAKGYEFSDWMAPAPSGTKNYKWFRLTHEPGQPRASAGFAPSFAELPPPSPSMYADDDWKAA